MKENIKSTNKAKTGVSDEIKRDYAQDADVSTPVARQHGRRGSRELVRRPSLAPPLERCVCQSRA